MQVRNNVFKEKRNVHLYTFSSVSLNFVFVINAAGDTGVNVHDCIRAQANKYSAQKVREAFSYLAQEGLIYSTIDEDHYATA